MLKVFDSLLTQRQKEAFELHPKVCALLAVAHSIYPAPTSQSPPPLAPGTFRQQHFSEWTEKLPLTFYEKSMIWDILLEGKVRWHLFPASFSVEWQPEIDPWDDPPTAENTP